MKIKKEKQTTAAEYAYVKKELIKNSKPCNERDLSCTFRPLVGMAPPR